MNNPWYDRVNGRGTAMQPQPYNAAVPQGNPLQTISQLAYAMQNPKAYAMNAFRDVPQEMWNNPGQVLQYIQQTRGISNSDLQNLIAQNLPR